MRPSASEMNSSEGFKRRLIRPTSSRAVDRNQQFLKMFDIAQNQSTIAALAKTDLIALQQDINALDVDKKIRNDDLILSKNYITTIRKWLKEVQNSQYNQEDQTKILKALNVDNVSSGFKKLWKIAQYLDNLLLKTNELNVIAFLKYDELFSSLTEGDIVPTNKRLNMLGQGFSAASAQMHSVSIERLQDLYSVLTKVKKGGKLNTSASKEQLKETKIQSSKLIAQLQEQNSKLSKYLQEMTKQNQLKLKAKPVEVKQQPIQIPRQEISAKVERSDLDIAVNQISISYQKQLEDVSSKLKKALDSQAHLKLEIRGYKQAIESSKKQSKENKPTSTIQSYEATLKEQLDSMKKGYENKITKLKQDYTQRQKELMRKENEYRVQNEKIKFERQLLMKKYDLTK